MADQAIQESFVGVEKHVTLKPVNAHVVALRAVHRLVIAGSDMINFFELGNDGLADTVNVFFH